MIMNNIKIFMKKKKIKGTSINVFAIKISLKMKKRQTNIFPGEYIKLFSNLWIST